MITKQLPAYTLVETLTAMTLLTLCFTSVFVSLYYIKTGIPDLRTLRAGSEIRRQFIEFDAGGSPASGQREFEDLTLHTGISTYGTEKIMKVEIEAIDANGKSICSRKKLYFTP